jgi:hypothetical protein
MRKNAIILITVFLLTAFVCAVSALASDKDEAEVRAKLEALVDEYIDSCNAKSDLLGSNSENIRRSATVSCMKASYSHHNKVELIQEMLDSNVEPKQYKVRHFLSEKFKDSSPTTGLVGK